MYRAAMRSILSELARQERLIVVEELVLAEPKTKLLVSMLDGLGLSGALLVSEDVSDNLYLASRNLHKVGVVDVDGVDPVSLIAADKVVITVPALKKFEELLG
jgi:large subunit ribosomal protein L4